jgi:mannosyl-oligosaccharide alpha-1,2-mannosidase
MTIADLCTSSNKVSIFLRHRGITTRHIAFGFAIAFFLWASYRTFLSPQPLDISGYGQIYSPPLKSKTTPEEWRNRAQQVKAAFVHAYHGYEKHSWKWDELKPLTNTSQNKYDLIIFSVAFED